MVEWGETTEAEPSADACRRSGHLPSGFSLASWEPVLLFLGGRRRRHRQAPLRLHRLSLLAMAHLGFGARSGPPAETDGFPAKQGNLPLVQFRQVWKQSRAEQVARVGWRRRLALFRGMEKKTSKLATIEPKHASRLERREFDLYTDPNAHARWLLFRSSDGSVGARPCGF